jgi:hypothetical protein
MRKRPAHKAERKEPGMGASMLLGLLTGIGMIIARFSLGLSEGILKAGLLTCALFWGLTTSFMSRWSDFRFWATVAVLLALHIVALSAVANRMAAMNLYSLLMIVLPEAVVMFVVLMLTGQDKKTSS